MKIYQISNSYLKHFLLDIDLPLQGVYFSHSQGFPVLFSPFFRLFVLIFLQRMISIWAGWHCVKTAIHYFWNTSTKTQPRLAIFLSNCQGNIPRLILRLNLLREQFSIKDFEKKIFPFFCRRQLSERRYYWCSIFLIFSFSSSGSNSKMEIFTATKIRNIHAVEAFL